METKLRRIDEIEKKHNLDRTKIHNIMYLDT